MSAVEFNIQPPVTVEYTGGKYGARHFRLFNSSASREMLLAAPETVDPVLPPRNDNWDGMYVDKIDVTHGAVCTDLLYTYSNIRQRSKTGSSFQTEEKEIPYFEWRRTPITVGSAAVIDTYQPRKVLVPMKIMRLRVQVQFSTAQAGWSLAQWFASAAQYTNLIFDLTGTAAFNQSVGQSSKLWLLEGADMQEQVRYTDPATASDQSWIFASYSFVREPGLKKVEFYGLGGYDGMNIAAGQLQTPWPHIERGTGAGGDPTPVDGRQDIWPPAFRSQLLGGTNRDWKLPPFERLNGVPYGFETAVPRRPWVPSFSCVPIAEIAPLGLVLPGLL